MVPLACFMWLFRHKLKGNRTEPRMPVGLENVETKLHMVPLACFIWVFRQYIYQRTLPVFLEKKFGFVASRLTFRGAAV